MLIAKATGNNNNSKKKKENIIITTIKWQKTNDGKKESVQE